MSTITHSFLIYFTSFTCFKDQFLRYYQIYIKHIFLFTIFPNRLPPLSLDGSVSDSFSLLLSVEIMVELSVLLDRFLFGKPGGIQLPFRLVMIRNGPVGTIIIFHKLKIYLIAVKEPFSLIPETLCFNTQSSFSKCW